MPIFKEQKTFVSSQFWAEKDVYIQPYISSRLKSTKIFQHVLYLQAYSKS